MLAANYILPLSLSLLSHTYRHTHTIEPVDEVKYYITYKLADRPARLQAV